ncbi:hypothetical protein EJ04DRAFT_46397 [Polyplosphaeria fusca]|uniref:Uncharacterized protein n=1 Tax=Polyplosphaeria fusca TaxID=682080 RepID=A0A9P4QT13_9PLEO|nr:hypothetical protein EJ04DRAFT_46397 [Polyplosphaeria fusca]
MTIPRLRLAPASFTPRLQTSTQPVTNNMVETQRKKRGDAAQNTDQLMKPKLQSHASPQTSVMAPRSRKRKSASRKEDTPRVKRGKGYSNEPKNDHFPFFALPRELRDLVYTHIWTSTHALRIKFKNEAMRHHDSSDRYYSRLPRSVLASRQLWLESIQQLQTHSDWIVGYSHKPAAPSRTDALSALTPWMGESLHLHIPELNMEAELHASQTTASHKFRIDVYIVRWLRALMMRVPRSPRIKLLCLHMFMNIHGDYIQDEFGSDVNLEPLSMLGALTRLESMEVQVQFSITCIEIPEKELSARQRMRVQEGVIEEIERVGRALVGEGKMEMVNMEKRIRPQGVSKDSCAVRWVGTFKRA